jgi:hypothetical protein
MDIFNLKEFRMLQYITKQFQYYSMLLDHKLGHYDLEEFVSPEQKQVIVEMLIQ